MPLAELDPELRRVARWLPRAAVGPRTLHPLRLLGAIPLKLSRRVAETVVVGSASVRVHRPDATGERLPALLWIHGGGYVVGSAAQDDDLCRHYARELGAIVASVDYRLAPEHPFPAPLDDCHDALTWLARFPGVDPRRIAVGGASAGGGLAAALVLLAHERREVDVAFQLLSYPMLDDRTAVRHDLDDSNCRLWNNKANRFGWQSYLGCPPGSDRVSGLAAPARYASLEGLPPAWIGVGTLDLFHDEDLAYARRLEDAGVGCQLHVVPGAFHGFDLVRPSTGVAQAFRSSQVAALRTALS